MCYPVNDAIAMKRLWCVFEIAATVTSGTKMHCAPEAPAVPDPVGFVKHVRDAVKTMRGITVNLEECSARDEEDKIMIMTDIEEGHGIEKTNVNTQDYIRASADTFEEKVTTLFGDMFGIGASESLEEAVEKMESMFG